MEKIFHFQLKDYCGNKSTLICYLKDGSISYNLYGGWNDSGQGHALSNLQCDLPLHPNEDETKQMFADRVEKVIRMESVKKVVNKIPIIVKFKE